MKSFVLLLTLAALTSASVLSSLSRQDATSSPVQSIGLDKYITVSSSPGSNCPKDVAYGKADSKALVSNFTGYGIEASMNFSEISVDGQNCTGAVNDTGFLAIMSRDEVQRFLQEDPLGLSEEAKRRVVVAGIDTQARRCGNYVASKPMLYFFTQEIGVFQDALIKQNAAPKIAKVSGEKWMMTYELESKRTCVYIDENAPSLTQNLTESPMPNALNPTATPTAPALAPPEGVLGGPDATPQPAGSGGSVCFPSTATVELFDGTTKTMSQIQLGDRVKVSNSQYSPVFMFTHKLSNVKYNFISINTAIGEIALTAGHYIYVNENLLPASSIKVGDYLTSSIGEQVIVNSVNAKMMTGLFNPQTIHGDIVVNGIRASTYTTVAAPRAAHALLAPLRGLYNRLSFTTALFNSGADNVAKAVNLILA